MPLRIVKASDPIEVKQLIISLYSAPGLGKTSTGFTCEAPLLLDFDNGVYRSEFRKDSVRVTSWSEIEDLSADNLAPYKTIVVDTAGRALDVLSAHLIQMNPKFKGFAGALTLQGFGALKAAFVGWLTYLRTSGKDVILLAHMDEQQKNDSILERLDIQGSSKGEIYKSADAMGRLQLIGGKRVLNFSPTDTAFGKNPAQLPPLPVPDFNLEPQFFAAVIQQIKDKLNESSKVGLEEMARLRELRESFSEFTEAAQFTAMSINLAKADKKDKALLMDVAKQKGFTFDKKVKAFIPAEAAAAGATI
jgi:hypothetical protein